MSHPASRGRVLLKLRHLPPALRFPPVLQIGPVQLQSNLLLAPIAGYCDLAFRTICREFGGVGLACTDLLSPQGLLRGTAASLDLAQTNDSDRPVGMQLYGSDPAIMAEAARIVVDQGAPIIDINMGCWVPKVVKKGGGAALLKDACSARAVVEAVIRAVNVPVTVKVRSGVDEHNLTAVPFARVAQDCGVSAITVHGRTALQGFTGEADWDIIAQVVAAVSIPVIGNGDVVSREDAQRMLDQTGCQAIMVGRAALGAPWKFAQWSRGEAEDPPLTFRAAVALRHLELTIECSSLPEGHAVRELRGQLSRYRLDAPGETQVRDQLVRLENFGEAEKLLLGLSGGQRLVAGGAGISAYREYVPYMPGISG